MKMKLFQKLICLLKKFGIQANKIELSANDVLNLLAGNEINLGSKQITIKSDNFNVDKNGNINAFNAILRNVTVNGGRITLKTNRFDQILQVIDEEEENTRFIVTPQSLQFIRNGNSLVEIGVNESGNGFISVTDSLGRNTTIRGSGVQ